MRQVRRRFGELDWSDLEIHHFFQQATGLRVSPKWRQLVDNNAMSERIDLIAPADSTDAAFAAFTQAL
ncbi:MAG: hypothetical protein M3Y32_09810, partial [Pseudomonadota bacterium]|nr:hypothetical protein [Pseudomonadota bacterium]